MFALMSNNNDRNKWVRQKMAFATASCVYSDAADIWLKLTYSLDKITSKKIFICPFYQSKAYTCIIWWTKMTTSSMRTFEIFDRRHTTRNIPITFLSSSIVSHLMHSDTHGFIIVLISARK